MFQFFRIATILAFLSASSSAHAALVGYTDKTLFDMAVSGIPTITLDFESPTTPSIINSGDTVDGFSFTYSIVDLSNAPLTLLVAEIFGTTSPTKHLGVSDSGTFQSGDSFDVSMGGPLRAAGLYVIGGISVVGTEEDRTPIFGPDNLPGDFTLTASDGSFVSNSDTPDQMVSDGAAFFLGLVADQPGETFDSFTLSSLPVGFQYNVDDITVAGLNPIPIPAAVWLFGSALLGLVGLSRRRVS